MQRWTTRLCGGRCCCVGRSSLRGAKERGPQEAGCGRVSKQSTQHRRGRDRQAVQQRSQRRQALHLPAACPGPRGTAGASAHVPAGRKEGRNPTPHLDNRGRGHTAAARGAVAASSPPRRTDQALGFLLLRRRPHFDPTVHLAFEISYLTFLLNLSFHDGGLGEHAAAVREDRLLFGGEHEWRGKL